MGKEGAFPQEIPPSRPLRRQREAFYQKRRTNGWEKGKTAGTKKRRLPPADAVLGGTLPHLLRFSLFFPQLVPGQQPQGEVRQGLGAGVAEKFFLQIP